MNFAHSRALAVAVPMWTVWLMWVVPRAARADALSKDVLVYDWVSLAYACGLGFAGGFLALLYALATDRRVVSEVVLESMRNALVSPIAGGATYLVLRAAAAYGQVVPTEPRFFVIIASGWMGIAVFEWCRDLVTAGAPKVKDGLIELAVAWLKKWLPSSGSKDQQP